MYYEERFIDGILMFRTMPDAQWVAKDGSVAWIANAVIRLSEEDRLKLFGYFCSGCGTHEKPCYCQNDE